MSQDEKQCMWCGETIKTAAVVCRFCNREQRAPSAEQVLYEGPGTLPIQQFLTDAILVFVLIGIPMAIYHYMLHTSTKFKVTTKRIEVARGLINRKVDVLDLARVQDIRFSSSWGFGTVTLFSSDASSPKLDVPIPQAQKVFEQLQAAIPEARKDAGVKMLERL